MNRTYEELRDMIHLLYVAAENIKHRTKDTAILISGCNGIYDLIYRKIENSQFLNEYEQGMLWDYLNDVDDLLK